MKVQILALVGIFASLASTRPYNHFTFGQDDAADSSPLNYIKSIASWRLPFKASREGYIARDVSKEVDTTATGASAATTGAAASSAASSAAPASGYWVASINRQGAVAFGTSGYKVYRNVKDYGAKGDGTTDDTDAINTAISDGNRCGLGCDSSTTTPAFVYFPAGTYVVSKPIVQYYYTQMVGDATNPPTLKAAANFAGMAVIDADPYDYSNGTAANWYTNQNNFFRQVRNFVIDLTGISAKNSAGIHWQVAQGTSLQNIRFEMVQGDSTQSGVFMDNGSGGFMSDLVFNGGNVGAFVGSQQFTSRNMTFNNCGTAVFMNWNWLWSLKSINVNNCKVGVDMANSPANQTVGSVLLQDSTITNTPVGVNTSFSQASAPVGGGTLIVDNVDFTGSPAAVRTYSGQTVLNGGGVVDSWAQGQLYAGSTGTRQQGPVTSVSKPAAIMADGKVYERSKPQYETVPASSFVSVKTAGAKGDGQTDDTTAIQNALNSLQDNQVLYFDHGAYIVTQTINVPGNKTIKMTGEIWPLIMAKGNFFANETTPQPVFSIGQTGDKGSVEMSDMIFETAGNAPGAIMIQWNSDAAEQGSNGMWDVHVRIGGSAGTGLQSDTCSKDPQDVAAANPACIGAHTLFHATQEASVLLENTWFWVADHELDRPDHNQVNVFNGRGVLIESQNPVWLYGTASEHSVLYQYQLNNAANVYMSVIQSETPYYQTNPAAPAPFTVQDSDPAFSGVASLDNKAWGLRIVNSSDVFVYGAGLYSFFDNYDQQCVDSQTCQNGMVSIEGATNNLNLFGLSTKAAVNMVSTTGYTVGTTGTANGTANARAVTSVQVPDADNRSNFCATLALWRPE